MKKFLVGLLLLAQVPLYAQELKENWDTYMASYKKGVGSVVLNMALKEKAPVTGYPFLVMTGVKIKDCTPEGFATEQEFQKLYKISDAITDLIDKKKRTIVSGTFTYQCERLDYFYVNDTTLLRKYLSDFYKTYYPQYSYIIQLQEDKTWSRYLSFLYPNEETMESMKNQKVLLQLTKAGDKLNKERRIDHTLYFKTEEERRSFFLWAYDQKFLMDKDGLSKDTSAHPFVLKMHRIDKPDLTTINRLTLYLAKEAGRFNGIYAGWETFVIKD